MVIDILLYSYGVNLILKVYIGSSKYIWWKAIFIDIKTYHSTHKNILYL